MFLNQLTLSAAAKKFDEFINSIKNHTQVLRYASGVAKPGIEIAGSARKKSILFISVIILVGVVVLLGLTGCSSRTPNIYKIFGVSATVL